MEVLLLVDSDTVTVVVGSVELDRAADRVAGAVVDSGKVGLGRVVVGVDSVVILSSEPCPTCSCRCCCRCCCCLLPSTAGGASSRKMPSSSAKAVKSVPIAISP